MEATDTANIFHAQVENLTRHKEAVMEIIRELSSVEVRIIEVTCEEWGKMSQAQHDDVHQTIFEQH